MDFFMDMQNVCHNSINIEAPALINDIKLFYLSVALSIFSIAGICLEAEPDEFQVGQPDLFSSVPLDSINVAAGHKHCNGMQECCQRLITRTLWDFSLWYIIPAITSAIKLKLWNVTCNLCYKLLE